MKTIKFNLWAMFLVLAICACGQRAATSQEAIEQAQTKPSTEEQVDYLITQANLFVNSKKFDEAINTAKYVLGNLDKNSQEAQSIIELAKAEMTKMAQQKLDEVKGEANKTIDGVKGKISSMGN